MIVAGRAEEASWSITTPEPGPIGTIPAPRIPITVTLHCDEITTIDPLTAEADFIVGDIVYRPQRRLIDSKSLHAYIRRMRNIGYSMERLATVLARDVFASCNPEWVEVTIHEKPRGGVAITAVCRIAEPPPLRDDTR